MIPSTMISDMILNAVYQRGLVIDSQLAPFLKDDADSVSKGIGD